MSSIHETAYPRFKSEITPRELADVYTPSPEEQAFSLRQGRTLQGRLAVLVLVKTAQRLGYFRQPDLYTARLTKFKSIYTYKSITYGLN